MNVYNKKRGKCIDDMLRIGGQVTKLSDAYDSMVQTLKLNQVNHNKKKTSLLLKKFAKEK